MGKNTKSSQGDKRHDENNIGRRDILLAKGK